MRMFDPRARLYMEEGIRKIYITSRIEIKIHRLLSVTHPPLKVLRYIQNTISTDLVARTLFLLYSYFLRDDYFSLFTSVSVSNKIINNISQYNFRFFFINNTMIKALEKRMKTFYTESEAHDKV